MRALEWHFVHYELGGGERVSELPCLVPSRARAAFDVQGNRGGVRKMRRVLREWTRDSLSRLFHRQCRALVLDGDMVLTREVFITALVTPQVFARGGGATCRA